MLCVYSPDSLVGVFGKAIATDGQDIDILSILTHPCLGDEAAIRDNGDAQWLRKLFLAELNHLAKELASLRQEWFSPGKVDLEQ